MRVLREKEKRRFVPSWSGTIWKVYRLGFILVNQLNAIYLRCVPNHHQKNSLPQLILHFYLYDLDELWSQELLSFHLQVFEQRHFSFSSSIFFRQFGICFGFNYSFGAAHR